MKSVFFAFILTAMIGCGKSNSIAAPAETLQTEDAPRPCLHILCGYVTYTWVDGDQVANVCPLPIAFCGALRCRQHMPN